MSELSDQDLCVLDEELTREAQAKDPAVISVEKQVDPPSPNPPVCQQPFLSSVHTEYTTSGVDSDGYYAAYRRSLVKDEWNQTLDLYLNIDLEDGSARAEQLHKCCRNAWFTRHAETGMVRVASTKCNLRWCPVCSASKAGWITKNIQDVLPDFKYPKFLTLTLKHSDSSLQDQIVRLYRCFNLLRKRRLVTKCISGGIWFFQIKKSPKTRQWHPHIHCIVTGKYIAHDKLKTLWHEITGDSNIVHIRMIENFEGAANEVARYAARPSKLEDKSINDMVEIYRAMDKRRICGTWGVCRKIPLRLEPMADKDKWINVGSFSTIQSLIDIDSRAVDILNAWSTKQPLAEGVSLSLDVVMRQFDHDYADKDLYAEPPPQYQQHLWVH